MNGPLGTLNGLRLVIVAPWELETVWRWTLLRPAPCPPRGERKGTRKMWKRAHPRGLRWRSHQVEVADHPILRADGAIYLTERTNRRLDAKLRETQARGSASWGRDGR